MTTARKKQSDTIVADAIAAVQRGEAGGARVALEALIAEDPGHAQAQHVMGVLLLQSGDAVRAVAHLKIAAGAVADPSVGINLAIALAQTGNSAEAQAVLLPIAEANPGNTQAAFNLGHLLAHSGKPADAEVWLRRSTTLDPGYVPAWSDLGALLLDDGRLDQAATCFARVLDLEPGNRPARFNMALVDHRQGRYAQACRAFEHCRAEAGTTREIILGLGASLQELGRIQDALAHYRVLLADDPDAYLLVLKNLTGCSRGLSVTRPSALRNLLGMDQLPDR